MTDRAAVGPSPANPVRQGARFEHASQLDRRWKPGPGQRYADGPKQTMAITTVRNGRVYYGYDGSTTGAFVADAEKMAEGGRIVGRWLPPQAD